MKFTEFFFISMHVSPVLFLSCSQKRRLGEMETQWSFDGSCVRNIRIPSGWSKNIEQSATTNQVSSSKSLRTFKTKLKTHSFQYSFPLLTVKWLQCQRHFSFKILLYYCIIVMAAWQREIKIKILTPKYLRFSVFMAVESRRFITDRQHKNFVIVIKQQI